jgi:hypothetical protein
MPVVITGDKSLSNRFGGFPQEAHDKLMKTIESISVELQARIIAARPVTPGTQIAHPHLRDEITARSFGDNPSRVASYDSVFAGADGNEYAKAATLEYGSDKARRIFDKRGKIMITRLGKKRNVVLGKTKAAHIIAYRYLRDTFAAMRPEIEAALNEALAEAIAESDDSG